MKAAEVTDAVVDAMREARYDFVRVNYANGDMVGHTGDLQAAIQAVEAVDLSLGRLLAETSTPGGISVEQLFSLDKGSFSGVVKQTYVDGWAYFLSVSKEFNKNHLLVFTALGNPDSYNAGDNPGTADKTLILDPPTTQISQARKPLKRRRPSSMKGS